MRLRRRHLAMPAGAAALAAAVAASLSPAVAAPGLQPVDGIHQAYVAEQWNGAAATPNVTYSDRWLTGTASDQANKSAGAPTATFGPDEPTGAATITQEPSYIGSTTDSDDRLVAKWSGPHTGQLDGPIEFRWYWTAAMGSLLGIAVEVAVIADPGTATEKVLGEGIVTVKATGTAPELNVHQLRVKGAVAETLMIQATPQYTDTGTGLRVHYGSTSAPSSLGIPVGSVPVAPRQDNDQIAYTGPPLEVSATYIGRDAAEPTIGVISTGSAFMAAGAFDAVPGGPPRNAARTEIWRSQDGGLTWGSVQTKMPGGFTTMPPTTLDPYVYVDEDTDRVFTPDLYLGCNYLQWSDDEGESWEQSPIACGTPINDHQTVVTGPPPEGVTLAGEYPNVVYYCYNQVADASCGRSLDGGLTWLPAGEPAFVGVDGGLCGGLHGHIITDSMGRLYLPKGHCEKPWLAISDDGAETWRNVLVNDEFGSDITHTAVDVDAAGTIYYLWSDINDTTPLLSYSKDGGETWSPPVFVSPPGVKEVNFPTIDAGKAGQIAITFPGSTAGTTEANRPWNYYVLTSLNADTAAPLFVSTTANPVTDPIHRGTCGPGRCAGMFDFIDVEFSPIGEIWAAATDTCTAELDCNTPDGVRALSADGVAIRQLSGPGLTNAPVTARVVPPAPRPAPAPVQPPLAATGAAAWVMWVAAAGVALGLLGRRRLVGTRPAG